MNWGMKAMTDHKDPNLDDFFAASRDVPLAPADDFMARLTAQALAEQPVAGPRHSPSVWGQLRAVLGGWAGMAGLATACAAGVWLGVAPPAGLDALLDLQDATLTGLSLDPLSGFDLAMIEG